jgi:antitoxin component YwqK of YwqJK toxin-antitoxin module
MNPVPLFLIIVSLPLLLGGCGGKSNNTDAAKNTEEKQQEVKNEKPVAETQIKLEGVNVIELEEREDIMYLKGSDTPYTGKAFTLYVNGMKNQKNYKDGKAEGLSVTWHKNGQKKQEVTYKDGKQEGLKVGWHENGKKACEFNYKEGKPDGSWTVWWENGQKQSETIWKDDSPVSTKEWNEKGNRF